MKGLPKSKKIIIANWKMLPITLAEAKKTFKVIKSKKVNNKVIPVICPSYLHLAELSKTYLGNKIKFGVQDIFWSDKKQHTGEISIAQVKNHKVEYVLVGHSERREVGETNEMVAKKMKHTIDSGLTPVLCVGEAERDRRGDYLKFLKQELVESLAKVSKKQADRIIVAYEPIWAVGKGKKPLGTYEIHQMTIFVKKILVSIYGRKIGMEIPVIYGGSVDADNSKEILEDGEVRGLLVGRASLNPHTFTDILKSVS